MHTSHAQASEQLLSWASAHREDTPDLITTHSHSQLPLDSRAAREPRVPLLVTPPVPKRRHSQNQPQQCADQIDPHGILHPLNTTIALGVLVNVHLAKHPEKRDPEDKQHQIPSPDEPEAHDERDQVEYGGEGGQSADDFSVDPFRVDVDAGFVCAVEVDAVEAADGEGEDELDEVEAGEGEVGYTLAEETHLDDWLADRS